MSALLRAASLLALVALLLVPGSAAAVDEGCDGTTAFGFDRPALADGCAVAVLTIAPNPAAPGETVSFSAAGSMGPEGTVEEIDLYAWDFGDGSPSVETSGQTTSHAYAARGSYLVQLTTLDADDEQIDTEVQELIVDVPPVAALAGPSGVVRPWDEVVFDATGSAAMAGGSVVAYRWDWGDGSPIEETRSPVATHVFESEAASSAVSVRAVDDLGVASEEATVAITVHNDLPAVRLLAAPSTVEVGQAVTLSADATDADGTIAKYEWDLNGDGFFETSTGTTPQVGAGGFPNPGTIYLRVRVTDDSKGSTVKIVAITVLAPPATGGGGDSGGGSGGDATGGDDADGDGTGSGTRSGGGGGTVGAGSGPFAVGLSGAVIQRLNVALRRGVGLRALANRAATGTLTLSLSARDARKLGLPGRRIGKLRLTVLPDRATRASVKLTRRAARALRRARPSTLRLTIRGTLADGSGAKVSATRVVLLRG
jgi:PKD repeat protein